jgi:hypothetical protein
MAGEPDDIDAMIEPVVPCRHRWLAGLLAAAPGDRVADLGCGTGSTLAQVDAGRGGRPRRQLGGTGQGGRDARPGARQPPGP